VTHYAAASHTHPHISGALIVVGLLILAAGYIGACTFWPFAACRRCNGSGKARSPSGKAWRPCRRCNGTGARVRAGRKAWTALSKRQSAAQKADRATKRLGRR
jgi:hypothetical protein